MTKISAIEGIGPAYARQLAAAGVRSTESLLSQGASRKGRRRLTEATGIGHELLMRWVNHADLFRIRGVAGEYAELLEASGVDTVPELAQRNPVNLRHKMVEVNTARKLVRQLPTQGDVADWVGQAQKLDRRIEY